MRVMGNVLREIEKKKDTYDQNQRADVLGTQNTERGLKEFYTHMTYWRQEK